MRKIEIDDEVFAYLQSKAIAYVETPNITLRRLFILDQKATQPLQFGESIVRRKKPKANMLALIEAGLLEEGQQLIFKDYQERGISDGKAIIYGKLLKYNGKPYSMSKLAKQLLQKQGYESDQVRGPAFWFTSDGISIMDIWKRYQKISYH